MITVIGGLIGAVVGLLILILTGIEACISQSGYGESW